MKDILAEYEQNIKTIDRILEKLRALPRNEDRNEEIGKWEKIRFELLISANHSRDYIRKVGDDEK